MSANEFLITQIVTPTVGNDNGKFHHNIVTNSTP
jgi:hypothetical protein